jgi:hypothetical protein
MKLPPASQGQGPSHHEWLQRYYGLAGLVPLDYGSRYEHSVVLVPSTWDSMFDLIRAPGQFAAAAQMSYGSGTPEDSTNTKIEWTLLSPITITIEPLTVQSQSTYQTLQMLSTYYDFTALITEFEITTPHDFSLGVKAAATTTTAKNYPGFPLVYVAEFAVDTRILQIKYIRPSTPPAPLFTNFITPATWSRVGATDLGFLHFDVDFGSDRSYETVADARASIAMDYIANPLIVNQWLQPQNINKHANMPSNTSNPVLHPTGNSGDNGFSKGAGGLFSAGKLSQLTQTTLGDQPAQLFGPPKCDPTVVIDSVWPDPDVASNERDTPPPPPPYLCINTTTEGNNLGNTEIKFYSA